MKKLVLLFAVLLLSGCTTQTIPVLDERFSVVEEYHEKNLQDVKEILNDVFDDKYYFYENKFTYSKILTPRDASFDYYEAVGGTSLIIEGPVEDFKKFVQRQSDKTYDAIINDLLSKYNVTTYQYSDYTTSDYEIEGKYSIDKHADDIYIYTFKIKIYDVEQTDNQDIRERVEPYGGARIFVKCSETLVVELFPDAYGRIDEIWDSLDEQDYQAALDNIVDFKVSSMIPEAEAISKLCKA